MTLRPATVHALERGAMQKPAELDMLVRLLETREPLRTVLEIGYGTGGTFALWCELAAPNARVITVDRDQRMELVPADPRGVFIRGDSHAQKTRWGVLDLLFGGRALDLLFLDGDHSYEGVRVDFAEYGPLVRPGGLIVLHDIVEHAPNTRCEVHRLWAELEREFATTRLVDPEGGAWGGLGILWR